MMWTPIFFNVRLKSSRDRWAISRCGGSSTTQVFRVGENRVVRQAAGKDQLFQQPAVEGVIGVGDVGADAAVGKVCMPNWPIFDRGWAG